MAKSKPRPVTRASISRPTGSDQVVSAFIAGWHMAELYRYERIPGEPEPDELDTLPGLGRLSTAERAQVIYGQIRTGLMGANGGEPDFALVVQALAAERVNTKMLKENVRALHLRVLSDLNACSPSAGRAYNLGRELAETFLVPDTSKPDTFRAQFREHRLANLLADLRDLRGMFPPHAAEIVESSLMGWEAWVSTQQPGTEWDTQRKHRIGQQLRRQGNQWLALLTGESDPGQLLRPADYLTAMEQLMGGVARMARAFVSRSRGTQGLLVAAGILSVLLLIGSLSGQLSFIAGIAVLFAGALGATAASVGGAVRRALDQVGAPLWEAELSQAMAAACTHLPPTA